MSTDITVSAQVTSFFLFCLTGAVSGLIYDFFKVLRNDLPKKLRNGAVTDIITAFAVFIFSLFSFYRINGIRLTVYHVIGYFLGGILYFSALSSVISKPLKTFFKIFKKILIFLLYPARFSCIMVWRICVFTFKPAKKIKKSIHKLFSHILDKLRFSIKRIKKI